MRGKVFVSYRRDDSQGSTGRLYDRLVKTLGKNAIFFDIESINPGGDFVEILRQQVGGCKALLVIIGTRWTTATNAIGERRLDDPADFVRIEVETALDRRIPVIPVLVDGARVPKLEELPDSLKALARRQAIEITHARFDFDADRLFKGIRQALGKNDFSAKDRQSLKDVVKPQTPSKWLTGVSAVVIVSALGGGFLFIWHLQPQISFEQSVSQLSKSGQAPSAPAVLPNAVLYTPPAAPATTAPAAPTTPPSQPANPRETHSSQADIKHYCQPFSFDGILRTQTAALVELQSYRANLIAGLSRFTPMMNPNDAASSLGYSSLFSTFYGQVEEGMPDDYQNQPIKITEVTAQIDQILQDEYRTVRSFSDDQYKPAVTYLWLYEQGLCVFPNTEGAPDSAQMLEMIMSKNLSAVFSAAGKALFTTIYNRILPLEVAKRQKNQYWSFWITSREWRSAIITEMSKAGSQ